MKTFFENIKPILALIVVVSTYSYFFAVLIIEKKASPEIIIAIVAAMTGSLGYYFGYSQGGSKKDEVIANIAANSNSQPIVNQSGNDPNVTVQVPPK